MGLSRRSCLAWATVVVLMGALAGVGASAPPAASAPAPLELVGRLNVDPNSIKATVVDTAKRQIITLTPKSETLTLSVVATTYDADTLAVVRTLTVPGMALPTGGQDHPVPYTWDQAHRRLFVGVIQAPGGVAPVDAILVLEGGERQLAVLPIAPTAFSSGTSIVGMGYTAAVDRLYLIAGAVTGASLTKALIQVNEFNPTTKAMWAAPYTVPSCETPVTTLGPAAIGRPADQAAVYVGCGTGNLVNLYGEPGLPAVARIDFGACNPATAGCVPTTTLYPVPGSYAFGDSLYDDEGGRFILASQGVGAPTQAAWVFDVAHDTFLGNISAGTSAIGRPAVASTGGRLYLPIPGDSLLVASDRGLKIGQANRYPLATLNRVFAAASFNKTVVLAAKTPDDTTNLKTLVYRVDADPYVAPPIPDPDAGTADIPEGPQTASVFGGDAKAFGTRVHQIGGIHGVQQNTTTANGFNSSLDAFSLAKNLANTAGTSAGFNGAVFPYNDNDRDVYTSRIGATRLSPQEASTSAVTADADSYTQTDLEAAGKPPSSTATTTTTASPSSGQEATAWPYTYAHCADFGKAETGSSMNAITKCDRGGGIVTANVSNNTPTSVANTSTSIGTGESSANTLLTLDDKNGIVVETMAVAKDVTIGPAHFGEISSVSHSVAHGRPRTASAKYTRAFKNVTMPGFACGDEVDKNIPGWVRNCDPTDVVNQLAGLLGSHFQLELPGDDTHGTPRGARGYALRDLWQHQQDVALNNQAETELQIPALRVIYYNDNVVRNRLIFEWAGTFADANYHIHHLPQADFDLEDATAGSALTGSIDGDGGSNATAYLSDPTIASFDPNAPVSPTYIEYAANQARRGLLLGHALRLLFTGRRALVLSTLLWGLFLTPAFLAGRRRYLLRTIGDTQ